MNCDQTMFDCIDNYLGYNLMAQELWLLLNQQKNYPTNLSCYALWQSFNRMAAYYESLGPDSNFVPAQAPNSYGISQSMGEPISTSGLTLNGMAQATAHQYQEFCTLSSQDSWPDPFEHILGYLNNLISQNSTCLNDCSNSTVYAAIANLVSSMKQFSKDCPSTVVCNQPANQKLAMEDARIVGQNIIAINASLAQVVDGYLMGLKKYINACWEGVNAQNACTSLVSAANSDATGRELFTYLYELIDSDASGAINNGFLTILEQIQLSEYKNLPYCPLATCTNSMQSPMPCICGCPGNQVCCADNTCCAEACTGNTCTSPKN